MGNRKKNSPKKGAEEKIWGEELLSFAINVDNKHTKKIINAEQKEVKTNGQKLLAQSERSVINTAAEKAEKAFKTERN